MPTPFPGMDPYLEHPALWPDVHNSLITAIRDDLASKLAPRYFVGVEERIYAIDLADASPIGLSDVSVSTAEWASPQRVQARGGAGVLEVELPYAVDHVNETYLEVRKVDTRQIVAVIEILSPSNKVDLRARGVFEAKRERVLSSQSHYVEIDLLRAGEPMPLMRNQPPGYRILISREHLRPKAHLLVFGVRDPIPPFVLPLLLGDDEPEVDLNAILHALYDRARYGLLLDYSKPAVPPLAADDAEWARRLVEGEGRS